LTKTKNANDTNFFAGYLLEMQNLLDAEGTQLPHASLREEVLSIFELDLLIELF
jgi:hypothetical protein